MKFPTPRLLPLLAAALLLSVSIAHPIRAFAQDDSITLQTLSVQLWPEYDQPSVLVIYNGVAEGAATPTDFRLTLPEGADVHVAAYIDEAGDRIQLSGGESGGETEQFEIDGNAAIIHSPNNTFYLEYYDPGIDTSGERRSYTFTWPGDYAVGAMTFVAQQPYTADEFVTNPAIPQPFQAPDGLMYYRTQINGILPGEEQTFVLTYVKDNDGLTVDQLPAPSTAQENTAPAEPSPGLSLDNSTVLIAVLVLAGLGLVGGGLYLYNRNRGDDEDAAPAPRRDRRAARIERRQADRRAAGRTSASRIPGGPTLFCTQCGAQAADPADRFCRKCGAPLRGAG